MRLYESIETNVLADDFAKYIKDKYGIEPKIDCAPSRTSKYAISEGLTKLVDAGIQCFQSAGLNVDGVSIGYPGSGDNGVWNREYGIMFTDDTMGETFDENLLRYEIKDAGTLDYIGEHLFKTRTIFNELDENKGLFKTSDDGEWSIQGYMDDGMFLYYMGRHRKEAIDKMKRYSIK